MRIMKVRQPTHRRSLNTQGKARKNKRPTDDEVDKHMPQEPLRIECTKVTSEADAQRQRDEEAEEGDVRVRAAFFFESRQRA